MSTFALFLAIAQGLGPAAPTDVARVAPAVEAIVLAEVSAATIADKAVTAMQKRYEKTTDFQATYTQRYTYTLLRRTQESTGSVAFKKPGLMRWDYAAPAKKSFVVDGKALWVYQPEDKTVMVNHCFQQDGLTASVAFLWGAGDIRKEFNVAPFAGTFGEKTDIHVELTPKAQNSVFAKLILVIDPKSSAVKQSIVVDPTGNVNQFIYSDLKFNTGAKAADFEFTPPAGVHTARIPGSCDPATKKGG